MKKEGKRKFYSIFLRYLILILIFIPDLWIFYFIFTPLTIYPVYFILKIFFDVSLSGNVILFSNFPFSLKIIGACVAGSAYYLLTILNLSIPGIKLNKRMKMLFLSFIAFLVINILRIVLLFQVYISSPSLFNTLHKITWYFVSVFLVVGIWFLEVKLFKIKEIPFYSDLKFISKHIRKKN